MMLTEAPPGFSFVLTILGGRLGAERQRDRMLIDGDVMVANNVIMLYRILCLSTCGQRWSMTMLMEIISTCVTY